MSGNKFLLTCAWVIRRCTTHTQVVTPPGLGRDTSGEELVGPVLHLMPERLEGLIVELRAFQDLVDEFRRE